ncbi:hypothetical protein HanIR_Chr06g0266861 [Helianthus annuus]|nr:hypothetical protein HanIR_Chr06g0266861 [Helianthus annuus]
MLFGKCLLGVMHTSEKLVSVEASKFERKGGRSIVGGSSQNKSQLVQFRDTWKDLESMSRRATGCGPRENQYCYYRTLFDVICISFSSRFSLFTNRLTCCGACEFYFPGFYHFCPYSISIWTKAIRTII